MKKILPYTLLALLILVYTALIPTFTQYNNNNLKIQKLGYTPGGKFLQRLLGEYRWFVGEYLTFKSIVYYGNRTDDVLKGRIKDIEYYNLFVTLETATLLNPYHEDTYYFVQATFPWDIGRVKEAISVLKYSFTYRQWDYQIPFFIGFDYAYFLKDYKNAAVYFAKASELTGSPLYIGLTSRFMYESGDTEMAINYIKIVLKSEKNKENRYQLEVRLLALENILRIERAIFNYKKDHNKIPEDINILVKLGYLSDIPQDPYGGKFYIDERGKVRSTSKLAFLNKNSV